MSATAPRGRPPVYDEHRKRVVVYLREDQAAELTARADMAGMPVSGLVEAVLVKDGVITP